MTTGALDPIPISALEHWSYCPRQCGLIHLEGTFTDSVLTVRGQHAHERAHEAGAETVDGVRLARGIALWSDLLGLIGKADVVEFRGATPYPVEYKVGKPGPWSHAELQLGAQAMCLEEMKGCAVPQGAVFYHATRHRKEVVIDDALRAAVREAVVRIRTMIHEGQLPRAVNDKRCPRCSLYDVCIPGAVSEGRRMKLMHAQLYEPDGWLPVEAAG